MQLRQVQHLEGHDDRVWFIAWSPSGTSFASCSGDKTIRIWSTDSSGLWKCTSTLEGAHTRTVRSCTWSPNGRFLATASFDRTIAIWEHVNGTWEQAAVLEGHESEVKGVAWNPNGSLIATCGRDRTVWVWEAQPGHEYEVIDVKHGHSQDVKTVVWDPHGELLVSASYDDTMKLWKESDDEWICCQTVGLPMGHTSTVWDVCFNPNGHYLASCSDDTSIKIWKVNNNGDSCSCSTVSTITGYHTRTIYSIDWSQHDYIATGSADNTIQIFKVTLPSMDDGESGGGGQCVAQMECRVELNHDVNCVRWNPKQWNILASAGDDGSIKIWELVD